MKYLKLILIFGSIIFFGYWGAKLLSALSALG